MNRAISQLAGDPLSSDEATKLLHVIDVFRDPVHGDISVTKLECALIDSPAFQRLARISQLGLVKVVYPAAVHTRFLHSIGTLHVCAKMLATCDNNATLYGGLAGDTDSVPLSLTPYCRLLARTCALLHDLAHVPFGHTLEKEGALIDKDEWRDEKRTEHFLGEKSDVAVALRAVFKTAGIKSEAADQFRDEVKSVLTAKKESIAQLRYPFVHDIVANTICADLIDYVQRDMYFCGLEERFGTRFLDYLAVVPIKVKSGKMRAIRVNRKTVFERNEKTGRLCRIALLQYRYNGRHQYIQKHGVVSEAIDLVRRRLALAEKVYFHRTKVAASSMLVSAAHSARLSTRKILDSSEEEVLQILETSSNDRAATIASKLRLRRIYKPIYRTSFHAHDGSLSSRLLWDSPDGVYQRFSDPQKREEVISELEALIGLALTGDPSQHIGSVVISCPNADMNVKAFDMLILPAPNADLNKLENIDCDPVKSEIRSIKMVHASLWRLEVYVDPDVLDKMPASLIQKLTTVLQGNLPLHNEVREFDGRSLSPANEFRKQLELDLELNKFQVTEKILHEDYQEIMTVQCSSPDGSKKAKQLLEEYGYLRPSRKRRRSISSRPANARLRAMR